MIRLDFADEDPQVREEYLAEELKRANWEHRDACLGIVAIAIECERPEMRRRPHKDNGEKDNRPHADITGYSMVGSTDDIGPRLSQIRKNSLDVVMLRDPLLPSFPPGFDAECQQDTANDHRTFE